MGKEHLTPWKKGQSGNPKGRPKGSKNRVSVVKYLEQHPELAGPVEFALALREEAMKKGDLRLAAQQNELIFKYSQADANTQLQKEDKDMADMTTEELQAIIQDFNRTKAS